MSSTHYSIISALVPRIVKKAVPFILKKSKLPEFDGPTQERITAKVYPGYYAALYGFWILLLLSSGFIFFFFVLLFLPSFFPEVGMAAAIWIALINMVGGWLVFGALLDTGLWAMSSANFRDYVMLRQLRSGAPYGIKDQIRILFILGGLYYSIMLPVMFFIIFLS